MFSDKSSQSHLFGVLSTTITHLMSLTIVETSSCFDRDLFFDDTREYCFEFSFGVFQVDEGSLNLPRILFEVPILLCFYGSWIVPF